MNYMGGNETSAVDMNKLAKRYNKESRELYGTEGRKVTRRQVKKIEKWVG